MRRSRAAAIGLGVVLAVAAVHAGDVRVMPLSRDGQLFVSFEHTGGFTPDVQEAIHAGLPTTFAYDIEVRRAVAFWFDRTLGATVLENSVRFDNLTRRHQLQRVRDGRVQDALVTENEAQVRRWMTVVDRLPVVETAALEANAEYYVRVRVRTRPRNGFALWPWSGAAGAGAAKFTFIP